MDTVSRNDLAVPASGELVLLSGPMFAGKSRALIAHACALRNDNVPMLVLTPAFDVRDGGSVLRSRDGESIAALSIARWPSSARHADVVVIDEVQFMVAPHYDGDIVADVLRAVAAGQRVVAGGLDTDYRRQPFEIVSRLAEHASRHVRLTARCHRCDAPAEWSARRLETGRRLELDRDGLYEARCDLHWSLPPSADADGCDRETSDALLQAVQP